MKPTATHPPCAVPFLFRTAKRYARHLLPLTLLTAVAATLVAFVKITVLPTVLYTLESDASPTAVLLTVAVFALAIFLCAGLSCYADNAFHEQRDRLRMGGNTALSRKALRVSYPLATDPAYAKAWQRAAAAMGTHIEAPIPHRFKTASDLLYHILLGGLCAVILCRCHAVIFFVSTLTALLSAAVHHAVSEWGYRHRHDEAAFDERLSYLSRVAADEVFSKDIRLFGLAPWIHDIYDRSTALADAFIRRRATIYYLFTLTDAVLTVVRNAVAYILLANAALTDGMPLWLFLLLFAATGEYALSIGGLFENLAAWRREGAALKDYLSCLYADEPFLSEDGIQPAKGCAHTLTLRDVTFTYPSQEAPTLHHINLTLHPDERLAVVGRDGAGKSTLCKLLCGLYDPDEGAVLLDGADVRTLNRRAFYELFSAVFQESTLPCLTIRELLQTDEEDDDTRLWEHLRQAGLADTVKRCPRGLDTPLGRELSDDGVVLSGDAAGRLLLARALCKDGDILLLDEPTDALDPPAEHALYREFDRMTAGKSAVYISHRLSSTRFCDRILCMKDGRICEEGTHDELMAKGGEYAQLFDLQSRYYCEGRDPDDDIGL